jgi:hypothetical protein
MSAIPTTVAGVRMVPIPDSALAREATEFVQDVSTRLLFDHSLRVRRVASDIRVKLIQAGPQKHISDPGGFSQQDKGYR